MLLQLAAYVALLVSSKMSETCHLRMTNLDSLTGRMFTPLQVRETDKLNTEREREKPTWMVLLSYAAPPAEVILCLDDVAILSMTTDAVPLSLRIQSKFEFDKGHSFLIVSCFWFKSRFHSYIAQVLSCTTRTLLTQIFRIYIYFVYLIHTYLYTMIPGTGIPGICCIFFVRCTWYTGRPYVRTRICRAVSARLTLGHQVLYTNRQYLVVNSRFPRCRLSDLRGRLRFAEWGTYVCFFFAFCRANLGPPRPGRADWRDISRQVGLLWAQP